MRIYKIYYTFASNSDTTIIASNSEKEAIDELKDEFLYKYNKESLKELIVYRVEKQ